MKNPLPWVVGPQIQTEIGVFGVGACRVRDYTLRLTRNDAPLLADNKQQELTSLILETPLPQTRIAVIGYAGQYDTVGKLIVQHNIKEVTEEEVNEEEADCDPVSRRQATKPRSDKRKTLSHRLGYKGIQ